MIRYRIDASDRHAHTYAVEMTIDAPSSELRLSLPVWIPGSYLVREFARHLHALVAEQGGRAVPVRQLDKATWLVRAQDAGPLVVRWRVYAFDTSVRAAFLGAERGFFNGTGVCLRVEGREHEPHGLVVTGLAEDWQVATALDVAPGTPASAREFVAPDYDALVDAPFELGRFWRGRFTAAGVPHEFVVAGAWPDFDGERLLAEDVLGWRELARRFYQRYHKPVMHTETNIREPLAVDWLKRQWANAHRLKQDGVPLIGFTWYSLIDQVDWDTALREDNGRVNPLGLYDLNRNIRPVGEEYKQLISEWKDVLAAESYGIHMSYS